MKKLNMQPIHAILAACGVAQATIKTSLPDMMHFDSNAPQGSQHHFSCNGWIWETKDRKGYISRSGFVAQIFIHVSDCKERIVKQVTLPYGGSLNSDMHKAFLNQQFSLNAGIK